MRKTCNFQLPRPFVIQSSKGLKRNGYVKYIIYPDLTRFKQACKRCPYIRHRDKRYYCQLDDSDFMLKFYGFRDDLPSGVYLCVGGVPSHIKAQSVGVEVEAYLSKHTERLKASRKVRTLNKDSGDSRERSGAFPVQSKQGVGNTQESLVRHGK